MHKKTFLIFAIFIMAVIIACTNEKNDNIQSLKELSVYFGGYFQQTSKFLQSKQEINGKTACYWILNEGNLTRKGICTVGEDVDLSPWIYVKNGEVYYVGTKSDGAYYWTITPSGTVQEYPIETDAEAWSVYVDENDKVYIAGQFSDNACYWVGEGTDLIRHDLGGSDGIHIAVSNNKVFVTGQETTEETQIAYCWIVDSNNEVHEVALSDESERSSALGAFLAEDGKYYIAGDTSNGPCYWVVDANNYSIMKKVDLATDDNDQDGGAVKIFVDENGVVYVAGYSSSGGSEEESHSIPVYWIDYGSEIKKHVLDENLDGWATAIWATKDKLYIAGQYTIVQGEEEQQIGCYWIVDKNNDIMQKHNFDKTGTFVNSIYVAK